MSNPSGAPAPFKMGDVELLMSPLTDKEIGELNNFIKQDILCIARDFCKTESNKQIIDSTMRAAMEQASKVDWIIDADLLQSIERMSYLLWLGTRNNPPKMARGAFTTLLLQNWEENFKICMDTLQLINPFLLKRKEPQTTEIQVP